MSSTPSRSILKHHPHTTEPPKSSFSTWFLTAVKRPLTGRKTVNWGSPKAGWFDRDEPASTQATPLTKHERRINLSDACSMIIYVLAGENAGKEGVLRGGMWEDDDNGVFFYLYFKPWQDVKQQALARYCIPWNSTEPCHVTFKMPPRSSLGQNLRSISRARVVDIRDGNVTAILSLDDVFVARVRMTSLVPQTEGAELGVSVAVTVTKGAYKGCGGTLHDIQGQGLVLVAIESVTVPQERCRASDGTWDDVMADHPRDGDTHGTLIDEHAEDNNTNDSDVTKKKLTFD